MTVEEMVADLAQTNEEVSELRKLSIAMDNVQWAFRASSPDFCQRVRGWQTTVDNNIRDGVRLAEKIGALIDEAQREGAKIAGVA